MRKIFISVSNKEHGDRRLFCFTMSNGARQDHCQCGTAQKIVECKGVEFVKGKRCHVDT